MTTVDPIPDGFHSVTPYLVVDGADDAMAFYRAAFGAVDVMRLAGPDGRLGHAQMRVGNSMIMLSDEFPDMGVRGPRTLGGAAVTMVIYVPDVDATVAQAVAAGGQLTREVSEQFFGDRTGVIEDPFGHTWHVHTHVRDVSQEELEKAAYEMMASGE